MVDGIMKLEKLVGILVWPRRRDMAKKIHCSENAQSYQRTC